MMSTMRKSARACYLSLRFTTHISNHRMKYTQSSEQCYTEGNMFKVSFLVCLALSFACGAFFAWGTGSRRGDQIFQNLTVRGTERFRGPVLT